MAYKDSDEILERLRSGDTTINSVNRQMLRWFNKKNIDKWLMWAKAKTLYLMEIENE
tara:strand:- start:3255 stop:3425 length:171 start_codon:yes stop_codon:yes gene_type:complete